MNCCGNHDSQEPNLEKTDSHNAKSHHKKHGWMMLLCCIVPMLLLGGLFAFNASRGQATSILGFGMVLLCPLMHLLMIPLFMGKKK